MSKKVLMLSTDADVLMEQVLVAELTDIPVASGGSGFNYGIIYTYNETADIYSNTAFASNTWLDLISNKTFTKQRSTSLIEILLSVGIQVGSNPACISSRLVVDSATSPQIFMWGNGRIASGSYGNPFTGSNPIMIAGLAAGTHTIKWQCFFENTEGVYLRANTSATVEFIRIQVIEIGG